MWVVIAEAHLVVMLSTFITVKNQHITPEDALSALNVWHKQFAETLLVRPLTWNSRWRIYPTRHTDGEAQVDRQVLAFRLSARGHLGSGATSEELPSKMKSCVSCMTTFLKTTILWPDLSNGNNTNINIHSSEIGFMVSVVNINCPFCRKQQAPPLMSNTLLHFLPPCPPTVTSCILILSDCLLGQSPSWLSIVRIHKLFSKQDKQVCRPFRVGD